MQNSEKTSQKQKKSALIPIALSLTTFLPLALFAIVYAIFIVYPNLATGAIFALTIAALAVSYPILLVVLLVAYFKMRKSDAASSRSVLALVIFVSLLVASTLGWSLLASNDRRSNENERFYFMLTVKSQLLAENSQEWNLCGKISEQATHEFEQDTEKLRPRCFMEAAKIFDDRSICEQIEESKFTLTKSITRQQCLDYYDSPERIDPSLDERSFNVSLVPIYEALGYSEDYYDFYSRNQGLISTSADEEIPQKYLLILMQQEGFTYKMKNFPDFSEDRQDQKEPAHYFITQ